MNRARQILTLTDAAVADIVDDHAVSGTLAIGLGESRLNQIVLKAAQQLIDAFPDVTLRLYSGNADDIKERLDHGLLDFGVVIDPADTYKYAYRRISGENRWGLLIPISDPLAAQTAISPETIRGQALIVSEREPVVKMLTDWAGHAFNPNQVVARYNLIYNAGLLAQLGSGYIVGLSHLIGHDEMQLKFIPFSPTLTSKMALIWTKNVPMSGAAQKFLEIFNQLIETV